MQIWLKFAPAVASAQTEISFFIKTYMWPDRYVNQQNHIY